MVVQAVLAEAALVVLVLATERTELQILAAEVEAVELETFQQ